MNDMAKKGYNKGEWSEYYAFLRILDKSVIYAANSDLKRIDNVFFKINAIIRTENGKTLTYRVNDDALEIYSEEYVEPIARIVRGNLKKDADKIWGTMMMSGERQIVIPEYSEISSRYHTSKVKADSRSKADITLEIYDRTTGAEEVTFFSIKSFAGKRPTLVNSSQQTNFIFDVIGDLDEKTRCEINKIVNTRGDVAVQDRVKALYDAGCTLRFKKTKSKIYERNMRMIDTKLPEILADMLLEYFSTDLKTVRELTESIAIKNPLKYEGFQPYYQYKIKKFLISTFTGMIPSEAWDGREEANGGYIVVKEDGEILCLHLNDRNTFEDYLYDSTKFDTGSAKRNRFGIVTENKTMNLNLDIRLTRRLRSICDSHDVYP